MNTPPTPPAYEQAHAYAVGDQCCLGGHCYEATTGGTTATSGPGPHGTGSAITDGSVVWKFISKP